MKKKAMLVMGGMIAAAWPLMAKVESVNGIDWCYYLRDDNTAVISTGSGSGINGNYTVIPIETAGAITIPSTLGGCPVKEISDKTGFKKCRNLTSVTIPFGIETIGTAFYNCDQLTSVRIPESVTTIAQSAFLQSGLTSVSIPRSVTCMLPSAFANCPKLGTATIDGSWTENRYPRCGPSAFAGCKNLRVVTIKDGVQSIPDTIFRYCESLTDVSIPRSVKSINSEAFRGCKSLTSLTIPGTLDRLGYCAFQDCTNLKRLVFLGDAPKKTDGAAALNRGNMSCTIYVTRKSSGWGVDIPGQWKGVPIRYLENE